MQKEMIEVLSNGEPQWFIDKRKNSYEIYKNFPEKGYKESPTQKSYMKEKIELSQVKVDTSEVVKLPFDQEDFVFLDIRDALKSHEDIVKKYFMEAVSPNQSKETAFNYAFFNSGKFIYVPDNTNVKIPVHLVQNSTVSTLQYIMVVVGKNSTLEFVEETLSENCKYHSSVVEVFLEENANIDYYGIQNLDLNDYGFCVRRSVGKAGSKINFVIGSFGAKSYVSNTKTVMIEEGAEGNLFEMSKTVEGQSMDITSDTHHKSSKTYSKIIAKGIGFGRSNSVFRGMIYMDQVAGQSVSNLQHFSLLLDEESKSNAIPGLEIKTNDVQAKHGSAVGHIDEDHIFYLMSRGLSRSQAERLIIDGFFEPVLSNVKEEGIQEKIRELSIVH